MIQLSNQEQTESTVRVDTLTNESGAELQAMNYGSTILRLRVPDREGTLDDVVLGFERPEHYRSEVYRSASPYLGAVVGRYANRIDEGRFELDGTTHQLSTNFGPNHLHGGHAGFDKQLWTGGPFVDEHGRGLRYTYSSPENEEGYPGAVVATVTYRLTNDNEVVVDYEAESTKATPVNLSQHTYFNLAGCDAADVLDHRLVIDADQYTPVDAELIPTGTLRPVDGTPFDFRTSTRIGARIDADHRQLEFGCGYDHNFVLNNTTSGPLVPSQAARVCEPHSGRVMTVYTTEPGLQFYSGNSLDGSLTGKGGTTYGARSGFCLETQHFPDSPNNPNFPSTILRPGETYRSRTTFAFSTIPKVDAGAP